MANVASLQREDRAVRGWIAEVSVAAQAFEGRWTRAALRRVDPELATRLSEQISLFDAAAVTGGSDEVEAHGAATCRGYAAAIRALEAADEPDDAYQIGQDPRTGFRVAIGHQRAAASRVHEMHGEAVVWISPDEVAALMAQLEGMKTLASIKTLWPGAEVIDVRPHDPAKREFEEAALMAIQIVADRIERMLIEAGPPRTVAEALRVSPDVVAKAHRRLSRTRQGIAVSRLPERTRMALYGAAKARRLHSATLARRILERVLEDDLVDAVLE